MFQNIDLFHLSADMARHAGRQQALIARNVANADTPGYKASRLEAFSPVQSDVSLKATRAGHIAADGLAARPVTDTAATSPNGNSVSLENEIFAAVDSQRSHTNALAIYRHAMTVIRTSLGR